MDESRFRVASVHHIYTRMVDGQPSGHICLCGEVMLTHRACTEHIVDAYRDDLRAQVEMLRTVYASNGAHLALRDVLSIIEEGEG
jgi:hypothetical protein